MFLFSDSFSDYTSESDESVERVKRSSVFHWGKKKTTVGTPVVVRTTTKRLKTAPKVTTTRASSLRTTTTTRKKVRPSKTTRPGKTRQRQCERRGNCKRQTGKKVQVSSDDLSEAYYREKRRQDRERKAKGQKTQRPFSLHIGGHKGQSISQTAPVVHSHSQSTFSQPQGQLQQSNDSSQTIQAQVEDQIEEEEEEEMEPPEAYDHNPPIVQNHHPLASPVFQSDQLSQQPQVSFLERIAPASLLQGIISAATTGIQMQNEQNEKARLHEERLENIRAKEQSRQRAQPLSHEFEEEDEYEYDESESEEPDQIETYDDEDEFNLDMTQDSDSDADSQAEPRTDFSDYEIENQGFSDEDDEDTIQRRMSVRQKRGFGFGRMFTGLAKIGAKAGTKIASASAKVGAQFTKFGQKVSGKFTSLGSKLKGFGSKTGTSIKDVSSRTGTKIKDISSKAGTKISDFGTKTKEAVAKPWDKFSGKVSEGWETFKTSKNPFVQVPRVILKNGLKITSLASDVVTLHFALNPQQATAAEPVKEVEEQVKEMTQDEYIRMVEGIIEDAIEVRTKETGKAPDYKEMKLIEAAVVNDLNGRIEGAEILPTIDMIESRSDNGEIQFVEDVKKDLEHTAPVLEDMSNEEIRQVFLSVGQDPTALFNKYRELVENYNYGYGALF